MEVVGVIAGVPGLVQIIQAVITAVRGVSKRDAAPKVAQNLIQSLRNVEQILERGKEQGLWNKPQFEQHKSTIKHWTTELASLKLVLQPSNIKRETRRSLKKFCLVLTELEKTLNQWSTRLSQIQTELILIMTDAQQRILRDTLKETVTARLRADLHPCSASFIPEKIPGTCDWIWPHTTFSDWTRGPSNWPESNLHRVLCIYGIKGCGKSVLARSIAQQLRERGQIALHFSFWSSNENQRQLEHLLRTVVWQVSRHITESDFEKLSKLLTRTDGIDKRSLVEAFRIALSSISQKVYCIIDGIDESTEDWNSDTDGCLSTVLDLVKNHTNLHVLLAGREASIRMLLKKAVPRLEITEHLVRNDIEKLISLEIQDSLGNYSPVLIANAQKDLQAKTQVMFLWVTLVLRELRRCSSIEDVRQTLDQVPHDLDREYHRLFLQLMDRTKGTRDKPSLSMKRAKYVLSSILACPEPMTGEDLCYAYATQANVNGTIEDDLITVDGISDACGDFLRVTEGRYHIIHASTSDFLIRPQSEWELEDTDISYFRVDLTEAQESMSLACFKYIRSIDLGYPLTDGGASSLPLRYTFFSYVSRYLPFHLAEALQENERVSLETSKFVRTHHFGALMEYLLAACPNYSQTGLLDTIYYWGEIFGATWLELGQAFDLELDRRERDFGAHDERYQSWLTLACLMPANAQKLPQPQTLPLRRCSRNESDIAKLGGNALSLLPGHIKKGHGPALQLVSGSLQAPFQIFAAMRNTGAELLDSSLESMPVLMLMLAAKVAIEKGNKPLTEKILTISVRKTRGKGNFLEMCSFLFLGAMRYNLNNDISETTEEMVRESVRIANCLPAQPHVQMLKIWALQIMILMLLQQERKVDAEEFITSRIDALEYMAIRLILSGSYTVSADFAAHAIDILAGSRSKPRLLDLSLLGIHRDALYRARNFEECVASCQQLLVFLRKLELEPMVTDTRWKTQMLIARCAIKQGNTTEANTWFSKAADEIMLLGPDEPHQKGENGFFFMLEDLALLGRYRRSQAIANELLEIRRITHSEDDKDLGFGAIESLVSKLLTLGCIDYDYPEFLRCHSLLMITQGIQDAEGKMDWFGQRLWSINEDLPASSKRIPVLKLKYIDICLQQDDGLSDALEGYKSLGRFFFEHGDIEASELVSSDAESRIFSHLSSDDPWAFKLASDICLYTGRFSKSIAQLCQAYQLSSQGYGDAGHNVEMEMFYACTCIEGLEEFEEDLHKADLRLAFLEKACKHLSKASRARDEIDRSKGSESQEEQRHGEQDVEESRKERMTDLKARLEDLNGGSMLTEAMARLGSVAPGAEVSSESNSW
ncbi:tetratricopeptide-like helical [Fusarium napiforme]|uniref:Tetratricopeptide-like helical n=1 Tax=Fusarium napiforme TaxID=42672 RepID=A0A8H5IWH9_9HYPO|nr:tetratricopeptide-like helical [Fusarium napiforme]